MTRTGRARSDDPTGQNASPADHDRFLSSGAVPNRVREVVADSWRRSAKAGVTVDSVAAPIAMEHDQLAEYRAEHPLSQVFPLLYDVLGRAAEECDSLMAVGDAQGQLLWVCGPRSLVSRAERINFVEGAAWGETQAGTNAPGTALRLDNPVQIRSSEHFNRAVQRWSCAAAPIHDPVNHTILGVVDITGSDRVATAPVMGMVRAAARMAESELGRLAALAGLTGPPAEPGARQLAVAGLGRPDCQLTVAGRTVRLSPRHSELVVLLVDDPAGLTGEQLAGRLYSDDVQTSSLRAELTRLRSILGPELLDSRPYRLRTMPACDWLLVETLLDQDRVVEALRAYRGPLLPQSEAPGVVLVRERLAHRIRAAVLSSGAVDLLTTWTRSRWGADDIEAWQRQLALLPADSPLRRATWLEVERLDRELGGPAVPPIRPGSRRS